MRIKKQFDDSRIKNIHIAEANIIYYADWIKNHRLDSRKQKNRGLIVIFHDIEKFKKYLSFTNRTEAEIRGCRPRGRTTNNDPEALAKIKSAARIG